MASDRWSQVGHHFDRQQRPQGSIRSATGGICEVPCRRLPLIEDKQRWGATTLRQIADALNADNTPAPRGGQWSKFNESATDDSSCIKYASTDGQLHRAVRTRPRVVTQSKFLLVEGRLQNQDGVIHVKANRLYSLAMISLYIHSHAFH